MLLASLDRSVLGKTVRSVLESPEAAQFFPNTDLPAGE